MANIYDQHRAAFSNVSAYVILRKGERVATVAFKFPRDGAGRLYVYVHWLGVPMVRGFAGGYGYDKRSAAARNAAKKLGDGVPVEFRDALIAGDGCSNWDRELERAGYTIAQAV